MVMTRYNLARVWHATNKAGILISLVCITVAWVFSAWSALVTHMAFLCVYSFGLSFSGRAVRRTTRQVVSPPVPDPLTWHQAYRYRIADDIEGWPSVVRMRDEVARSYTDGATLLSGTNRFTACRIESNSGPGFCIQPTHSRCDCTCNYCTRGL